MQTTSNLFACAAASGQQPYVHCTIAFLFPLQVESDPEPFPDWKILEPGVDVPFREVELVVCFADDEAELFEGIIHFNVAMLHHNLLTDVDTMLHTESSIGT